jgi:hypothetical protein
MAVDTSKGTPMSVQVKVSDDRRLVYLRRNGIELALTWREIEELQRDLRKTAGPKQVSRIGDYGWCGW